MARKLFALEDMETLDQGEVMEISPEAGEVADVQAEVEQEATEVAGDVEAIETGVESADQLEEVSEVIEQAVEEEGGLTPVAAEAIRLAVEAISARVGYNPKAVYALYATENFQSTSSRKANTAIAMEGVVEFLKDLWKRIKAAVNKLIEKVKAFWEKHFSDLGRVKKALESMKAKVSESSGKIKDKAYFDEAPTALVDAFVGTEDINSAIIAKFIKTHLSATIGGHESASKAIDFAKDQLKVEADFDLAKAKAMLGDVASDFAASKQDAKSKVFVGGIYFEIEVEGKDTDEDFSLSLTKEYVDEKDSKLGISVADKAGLQTLLKDSLQLINETIKVKERFAKVTEAFNKFSIEVEKLLGKAEKPADEEQAKIFKQDVKNTRAKIKSGYKAMNFITRRNTEVFALNVKLAKAVINYTAFCLKNYKAQA